MLWGRPGKNLRSKQHESAKRGKLGYAWEPSITKNTEREKNGARSTTKNPPDCEWGKIEAQSVSSTRSGENYGLSGAQPPRKNGSAAAVEKIGREAPEKKQPLRGRVKNGAESTKSPGNFFMVAGAKKIAVLQPKK